MSARAPLRSPGDRLLVAGIAFLLLLSLGLVALAWIHIDRRAVELTDDTLRDRMASVTSRLDGWFEGWENTLNVEAVYVAARDSLDTLELDLRWRTLLKAYWPVTGLRLADERGSEIALTRVDTGLQRIISSPDTAGIADSLHTVRDPGYDPRRRPWFSQALQNRSVDPIWSAPMEGPGLHLSSLIRSPHAGHPYRIMLMELDPQRAGSEIFGRAHAPDAWLMLIPSTEAPVVLPPLSDGPLDEGVVGAALDRWRSAPTDLPFSIEHGGVMHRCWIKPFHLNGVQPALGVIVPFTPWGTARITGRLIVLGGLAIILLLGALLITAYLRKQGDLLRLRAQEEKARAQHAHLVKALGERDVLDREVHHRVKNNLQVVSSLLNLQAQRVPDGQVKDEFLRGKRRIDTMALVHHKLYGMPDLRGIDLKQLFDGLVSAMHALHEPRSSTVSCQVATSGIHADTDTAIELGIILCELVSNCYQHAFPYATGGHIDVSLTNVEQDLHRLLVKDNGRGLDPGGAQGTTRLGLEIVDALAGQLDGNVDIRSNGGVTFEVLFRMTPARPAAAARS